MSKLDKLIDRITNLGKEPEHDGLRVSFCDGSYIVTGAVPAEKNGTFDADGERLPEVIAGVTDSDPVNVKVIIDDPVNED